MQVKSFLFLFFLTVISYSYAQKDWFNKGTLDSMFFTLNRESKPGFGITVIQEGEVIYNNCIGMANVSARTPFSNHTQIALASVSKQFTAMSILLLEESGKLSIQDDIRSHIPELPDYPKTITIHHLLTHTSGIRDHITMLEWMNNQKHQFYDFEGTLECLKKFNGISFEPGDNFAYSNTGFVLLALIVERVSGMPFEDFVQKNIFTPLEMNESQFSFKGKSAESGNTASYNWKNNNFIRKRGKYVNALGATGVYTTLADMEKWDQNFYKNVLGKGDQSLIERMNTSGYLNDGSSVNYGNGQKYRNIEGVEIIEHSGGWAFFNFQYTRIPSLQLSIIVATNNEQDYPIGMSDKILAIILGKKAKTSSGICPNQKDYSVFEGTYIAPNTTLRIVAYDPPNLRVIAQNPHGIKSYSLTPVNDRCFADSMGFQLCFDAESNASFNWQGGAYFPILRTYTHVDPIGALNPERFIGKYFSEELGTLKIKYHSRNNELYFTSSFRRKTRLTPEAATVFKANKLPFTVQFKEDYLLIGNNRVYNLKFNKVP